MQASNMIVGTDSSTASCESNEEYFKTGNYLRHLSGQDRETSQLILEHNYSKPWTWKPENSFTKPTRTLFTSLRFPSSKAIINPDEIIDVENIEESASTHLPCVFEADDCELYAEELRASPGRASTQLKEDNEDWELNVPRIGWTAEHLRLFSAVVRALHELQLARLALVNRADEAVQRRLAVDTAARRVRRAMASVTWDLRLTHWLHATLQEHMPTPLLAIYLEVLQTLRAKVPTLVDQMLSLSTYNRLGVPVSEELLQLLQKPWDPAASSLAQHKPRKLPMEPILVVVPSGIGSHIGHNSRRSRNWISQMSVLGKVVLVSTQATNLTGQSTIENMLDQLLTLTRARIEELKNTTPGRPIILVGWNVGASIACQAALMETVASVICLGFPIGTLTGRRGQADDAILDLQCPVFFVVGQNSATAKQADLEELRERLRVQSGLLVVGAADDQLRMTGAKKRHEGLTQSMVDRCILDEVGDFLGSVLTKPVPAPPPSPVVRPSSVGQSTPIVPVSGGDNTNLRRQSSESGSLELEPPDAKRSRSATPLLPASPASTNSTPTKLVYSNTKQETSLATNRTAQKRVYEGNASNRNINTAGKASAEKRGIATSMPTLGSRHNQSGITVNIGSLASLAPTGPIRLGDKSSDPTTRTVTPVRPAGVRVPSTPTTHSGITSLSSLLAPPTISKSGTSSILLTSNSTGHIKVLGGEDAATHPRSRTLDLSRVTLLTSGTAAKTATSGSQAGVVMVNTGKGNMTNKLQQSNITKQLQSRHVSAGTTLAHHRVAKTKTDQGSAKNTILQSSSIPLLLSCSSSTTISRPAPPLSPSTILELPVIFAKDGDPDAYSGAAALTAPVPVTISQEVAAMAGILMDEEKTSSQ